MTDEEHKTCFKVALEIAEKSYPDYCKVNLKISSDGKLLHEPDGNRLGLDVPPEAFFKYDNAELNLRMYFDSNRNHVILCNTKTKEFLEFSVSLYNNDRAWFIKCCSGNMLDTNKININSITDVLYRDLDINVIDEFIDKIITLVRNTKSKTTTLDEDYRRHFDSEWEHRFSYLDDYLHGYSEDSESAFYSLKNLKENCEKYGKTWDVNF